jgi:hypothetical protein
MDTIDKLRMGPVDGGGRPAYELLPGGIAPFNAEKIALALSMKEKGATIAMDVKPSTVMYLNRRGANLRIVAGWRNQQPNWVMGRSDIGDAVPDRRYAIQLRGLSAGVGGPG